MPMVSGEVLSFFAMGEVDMLTIDLVKIGGMVCLKSFRAVGSLNI